MESVKNVFVADEFKYGEVFLTEPYCQNAYQKMVDYLLSLEPERLLVGFMEVAGLETTAKRYGGWEVTEIQGHTLGHYLTALSQAYGYLPKQEVKERIDLVCEELMRCQREDGFLFASPEEFFDRVEKKQPVWVPWYNLHKLLEGLLAACQLGKSEEAYKIASKIGDWVYARTSKWSEATHKQVLSVEYGGMNDCLYTLYTLTGKPEHLSAAHAFDELELFDKLNKGQDVLNGRHANTTIPKIIGAINRYTVVGEDYYLKVAENFWNMVTGHHSYITGGNSEWEHFGEPDVLDRERTACNCETCNTYNMLKLTLLLFKVTGDHKYADFYEKAWINTILSSQNPETGMTTYFQPMATGFFKVFSSPYDHFWCCTGTGMENFTKLSEGIFFYEQDLVYINRYISADLNWKERGVKLQVKTQFPNLETVGLKYSVGEKQTIKVRLSMPCWLAGEMKLYEDGKEIAYMAKDGYGEIPLSGEGELTIKLPMALSYEALPDHPSSVAFMYGPVVLSALLGNQQMECTETGVNVTVPKKPFYIKDYIVIEDESTQKWLEHLDADLYPSDKKMEFVLQGGQEQEKLNFVPHFSQYKERYGIYWSLYEKGSKELQETEARDKEAWGRLQENVDCIPVGNEQYELAHHIRGVNMVGSGLHGHRCRVINPEGYLQYEMKCPLSEANLSVVYAGEDKGSEFEILINGKLLASEKLTKEDTFYTKSYEIPQLLTQGKEIVEIQFKTQAGRCRIFDELFITTHN